MTRLYAYGIAALALLAAFLGLYAWGQQGHRKADSAVAEGRLIATQRDTAFESLRLAARAAELERSTLRDRAAVAESQQKLAEARAKDLNEALDLVPDWSRTRIPAGVLDVLRSARSAGDQAAAPGKPAATVPAAKPAGQHGGRLGQVGRGPGSRARAVQR